MSTKFHPPLSFLLVSIGVFLSTMDSSMVNIALPYLMKEFGASIGSIEWVVLIYLLTITVTLLLWGKLGDRIGKAKVYLSGMLLFSISSVFCFYASSLLLLICCRFFQGLGAAMMMANGPAIIKAIAPKDKLGAYMGFIGIATSIGLLSGPVVSGYLIQYFSWRTIFLATVPVSLVSLCLGFCFLVSADKDNESISRDKMFDWYGLILWTAFVTVLILLTTYYRYLTAWTICTVIFISLILLWLFIRAEKKSNRPLLPIALCKDSLLVVSVLAAVLSFAVLFVVLILMPFFFQYVLHLSATEIGYMMMAMPLTIFVISPLAGKLADIFGAKLLTVSGMAICCLSLLLLSGIGDNSTKLEIASYLALLGAGQSIFLSPNSSAVLSRVSHDISGVVSGVLAAARNMGMLMGIAIGGMVFAILFKHFSGVEFLNYQDIHLQFFLSSFKITILFSAMVSGITSLMLKFKT